MKYAKTYCTLKADLSANIAAQKILMAKVRAYEQSSISDAAELEILREKLRLQTQIVNDEKKQILKLETELKKLSADLDELELKVFTLHYIKGCKLTKIAKKLYFSYDRVKQINKEIKEKISLL